MVGGGVVAVGVRGHAGAPVGGEVGGMCLLLVSKV